LADDFYGGELDAKGFKEAFKHSNIDAWSGDKFGRD
jgi:hypothetical protein